MIALTGLVVLLCGLVPSASAGTLYTNNYNDKQLAALTIGADGLLSPLPGSPFPAPFYAEEFAITPDGNSIVQSYGFDDHLGTLAISTSGAPSVASTPLNEQIQGFPAVTPDGRFVYVPGQMTSVHAYGIGAGGSLTPIGTGFGTGATEMVAVTPNGRFLLLPDYLTDSVERFAIQADGTLAPLGSTPLELHNPLSVRITPDGRFAVFVNAPSSPGETKIQSLAIGSDGSLTSTGPALATTGDSTSAATITPNGHFAYVGNGNEDSITAYSIGPSGVLTQLGVPTLAGLDSPDALGISNDGRFLYASDSHGEEIQAFSIGADGALIKIGTPVSTGGESDGSAIVARPAVPVASLAPVVPRIEPGKRVSFNASGSHDVGAAITGYSWNFGDGASAETPGPTTGHAYKPGVYTVSVTVKDADGCSGFVYTGQSAYCNGNAATASLTVDTVPVIQGMTATPKRFPTLAKVHSAGISVKGKKRRGGTTFHYKLTETARVSVAIQRKLSGRKVGKACKRPTKANAKKRKCVRLKTLGSLVAKGKAGKNKLRFSGKLRGKPLPPGRYLATATAIDSAKGKSTPRSTSFEVLPPR